MIQAINTVFMVSIKFLNNLELIISEHKSFQNITDISNYTKLVTLEDFKKSNDTVLEKLLDKKSLFYEHVDKTLLDLLELFNEQILKME